MPNCKQCGSSDVANNCFLDVNDQLRCNVCDAVIPTSGESESSPAPTSKTASAPPFRNSVQQWEYNVVRCAKGILVGLFVKAHQGSGQSAPDHIIGEPIGKAFNLLGKAGWELVSSETEPSWLGPIRATKTFIFKRPLRS